MYSDAKTFRDTLYNSKVPVHLHEGLLQWVEKGIIPGGYLRAVLSNDLVGAVLRGDSMSRSRLVETVQFIWSECPDGSCGTNSHKWKGTQTEAPTDV